MFVSFRCLVWDPAFRMTPSVALRHAWLRRRLPRPPDPEKTCSIAIVRNICLIMSICD